MEQRLNASTITKLAAALLISMSLTGCASLSIADRLLAAHAADVIAATANKHKVEKEAEQEINNP